MGRLGSDLEGAVALWFAQNFGDFSRLAERVRKGRTLLPGESKLAADLILGKIKRPRHRPLTSRGWQRDEAIDDFVSRYLAEVAPKKNRRLRLRWKNFILREAPSAMP